MNVADQILERDKDAQEKAPQVLKDEINQSKASKPSGSRSYSTSARRPTEMATVQFHETQAVGLEYPDAGDGHKFPLPDLSEWTRKDHIKRRYDPVVEQLTKMIMRDGKLSKAQSVRFLRCMGYRSHFGVHADELLPRST